MTDELRIVDAVFGREDARRKRRYALAVGSGVGLHVLAVVWAVVSAPSLETWSAELATRVHAELTRQEVIDLPPPPVAKKQDPPPAPPKAEAPVARAVTHLHHLAPPRPSAPAQAGKIVAAAPSVASDAPLASFVSGNAPTYAGGVTMAKGTNKAAVFGPVAPDGAQGPAKPAAHAGPNLSSPVSLDDTDWNCPWPHEADADSIDDQSVVLQVTVRGDGTAESARTLSDPGHGFAAAARTCAMSTHFTPAHDAQGRPVRAASPPIRVHFTR